MKKDNISSLKSRVGYIILTWNSEKQIESCLNSIYSIKGYLSQIIVVDNGSSDNTVKIMDKYSTYSNFEIICLPKNFGTTISRNIAIKKLIDSVDYICILDSDTIINEAAIDTMIQILNKNNHIGIVGPKMQNQNGTIQDSGKKFPSLKIKILKACPIKKLQKIGEEMEKIDFTDDKEFYEVDYLMSACWLMKNDNCKKIGLLDEKIFYAPEDVEYCMRAKLMGYKIVYTNQATIIHEWQRLSKKKLISKINFEHIKGLIYYFKKYHYLFNADNARLKGSLR